MTSLNLSSGSEIALYKIIENGRARTATEAERKAANQAVSALLEVYWSEIKQKVSQALQEVADRVPVEDAIQEATLHVADRIRCRVDFGSPHFRQGKRIGALIGGWAQESAWSFAEQELAIAANTVPLDDLASVEVHLFEGDADGGGSDERLWMWWNWPDEAGCDQLPGAKRRAEDRAEDPAFLLEFWIGPGSELGAAL